MYFDTADGYCIKNATVLRVQLRRESDLSPSLSLPSMSQTLGPAIPSSLGKRAGPSLSLSLSYFLSSLSLSLYRR